MLDFVTEIVDIIFTGFIYLFEYIKFIVQLPNAMLEPYYNLDSSLATGFIMLFMVLFVVIAFKIYQLVK